MDQTAPLRSRLVKKRAIRALSKRRVIAVVTGSRADWGLLVPVVRAVIGNRNLKCRLVVTGTHLTRGTWRDVAASGFEIDARVRMQQKGESGRAADVRALARGIEGLGKVFERMRPDVVVVLGDRIEALAGAAAGQVGGYRVGHIHGGDRAEGVADEAMRHAISKLTHVHFAASRMSRERLIRMGEEPGRVFNVGSPAVDGLARVKASKDSPGVIVLQHPIGGVDRDEYQWMKATLEATRGYKRMVMAPNSDPGSEGVRRAIGEAGVRPVTHLSRERFLSLLAGAGAIVGNSSAGLIEAAALRPATWCVNVGPRQAGREKPGNVIDCDYGEAKVERAVRAAMRRKKVAIKHPYGDGASGKRIAEVLTGIDLEKVAVRKRNAY